MFNIYTKKHSLKTSFKQMILHANGFIQKVGKKYTNRLTKKVSAHFCTTLGVAICKNYVTKRLDSFIL